MMLEVMAVEAGTTIPTGKTQVTFSDGSAVVLSRDQLNAIRDLGPVGHG